MGALNDIDSSVKRMQKSGQVAWRRLWVPPGREGDKTIEEAQAWQDLAASKQGRGALRAVKEFVPSLIDGTVGTLAGLGNGIVSKFTGGTYSKGYDDSKSFVRRWYSDPLRKAEMALGGNLVKRMVDRSIENQEISRLNSIGSLLDENGEPTEAYKDFIAGKELSDSLGNAAEMATGIAISMPAYGAAYGKSVNMLGHVLGGGKNAVRVAQTAGFAQPVVEAATEANIRKSKADKEGYRGLVERLKRDFDPGSEEYAQAYYELMKKRSLDPESFSSLEPPSSPVPSGQDKDGTDTVRSDPKATDEHSTGWWSALPESWRGGISEGAGAAGIGALLGLIFGGKKRMSKAWKLAILGSILGGAHGSGAFDRLIGMMSGKKT